MSIQDYYKDNVEVQRLTVVEELYEPTNKKTFTVHIASLDCNIQPFEDNISQDINTGFGKDWLLFCDVVDIVEGDRIIWDTKEYRVVSLESFTQFGTPHLEIRIRAFRS